MFTICRFTPPTCTLEIKGKKSLWFYRNENKIANEFQFELGFDDPRKPNSVRVTVMGDRQDFQQLEMVVENYIKKYLARSFSSTPEQSEAELTQNQQKSPQLRPQGTLYHELWFGSLNHDGKSQQIILSTVQLFDLVTATAAFKETQATLSEKVRSNKNIPLWGGIVTVAIATVGTIGILSRSPLQQPTATSPNPTPPQPPPADEIISPETPPAIEQPELNSEPKEPLTSAQRLPPPPAVDAPKPKPDIPDPADYPLQDVAKRSQLDKPRPSPTAEEQTESTIAISPSTNSELSAIDPDANSGSDIIPKDPSGDTTSDSPKRPDRIQQVTAYFQENWQPPADLNQSLEYRLSIDADGAIARVTPLGKASSLYLSQTNIPVNGEQFVTPIADSRSSTIRLLLNPNGNVRAFIEKY